jgi:Inorganic pyrophosphatase/exopolyphosphatase
MEINKDTVYVTGHRNPDTDSIISAIAYANLMNEIKRYNAIPVRLGIINRETEYILDRFNLDIPILMKTVKQKVEDLNYDKVTLFSKKLTLKTAWSLMKYGNLKSAPILDENFHLSGLLSTSNIVQAYMEYWGGDILGKSKTPIENIVDTLEGTLLHVNRATKTFDGHIHVATITEDEVVSRINKNDIVIISSNHFDIIDILINRQVSLIILTGSITLNDEYLNKIKKANITILSTPFNTFLTSQHIIQTIPVEYLMKKGDITTFSIDDTVDYVKSVMSETKYNAYPVLDLNNRVVGSLTRQQLLFGLRKKVIQVDHNERGQSIEGIEEAEILEIIDHHRVADIQTIGPVYFRNEPVGSTSTIIAKAYKEYGVTLSKEMAGALLGAIISDTVLFKSPTCTPIDTAICQELAKIAKIDIAEFGQEMFKAGTSLVGKTVEQIFNQDYKRFTLGKFQVGIAQVNSMDIDGFEPLKDKMINYMDEISKQQRLDICILLLTDIINVGSKIFAVGKKEYVNTAFNIKLENSMAYLPSVISRKNQIVPALTLATTET